MCEVNYCFQIQNKCSLKILLIILFFIPLSVLSQLNHITILVGEPENRIRSYLDSLNHLKYNAVYKIEKDVNGAGDLVLKSGFSIIDQDYYGCLDLTFVFNRINGDEICVYQAFWGDTKYAYNNLNYIKDNFKKVDENKWEKVWNKDKFFKILAAFSRISTDQADPFFLIEYNIVENK